MAVDERPQQGRVIRMQVRLAAELYSTLSACAKRSGLSSVGLVRVILEETLAKGPANATEAVRSRGAVDLVALAALVAGEHALKLYELTTPGGSRFSRDARAQAFAAAEERLKEVRTQIEEAG
jgi:hypothetical protein